MAAVSLFWDTNMAAVTSSLWKHPVGFSGSDSSLFLKLGIRDFEAQSDKIRDFKYARELECPNDTRDYGIKEPYWGLSYIIKAKVFALFFTQRNETNSG